MKKYFKLFAGMMAFAFVIGTVPVGSAQAATASQENIETGTYEAGGNQICNVEVTKASSFSVTIPKNVVLGGAAGNENSVSYTVTVKGDLAGYGTVTVDPEDSFAFSQTDKDDITATVEQTKTTFSIGQDGTIDNFVTGVTTDGTIKATGLTAGKWTGSFQFAIGYAEAE